MNADFSCLQVFMFLICSDYHSEGRRGGGVGYPMQPFLLFVQAAYHCDAFNTVYTDTFVHHSNKLILCTKAVMHSRLSRLVKSFLNTKVSTSQNRYLSLCSVVMLPV